MASSMRNCLRVVSADLTYVNEFYSKTPQKLSKYSWFGNVRLYQFSVPEDAVFVRWLLTVIRGSGFNCENQNIAVHFRAGAPPVIDPILTAFPNSTVVSLAYNLTLTVRSGQVNNATLFNVTQPVSGDWFLAAHLPKDDGKIEQQGLPSCSYMFQPQMYVRRAVDTPILMANIPLTQTLTAPVKLAHLKYALCVCLHVFTLGSSSLGQSSVFTTNCSGVKPCTISISNPPWNAWMQVTVETSRPNVTATFSISASSTVGCKPLSIPSDFNTSFSVVGPSLGASTNNASSRPGIAPTGAASNTSEKTCLWNPAMFREDQDVLSVRFALPNGNTSVASQFPTVLTLDLHSTTDSGGVLTVQLDLNTVARHNLNCALVFVCIFSFAYMCIAFVQGYSLEVNSSETKALLRIPFPDAALWYLSLQTICNNSDDCANASAAVAVSAGLTACIDDCGPHGECRLLRTQSYLYAACVCHAGWLGWGCSDSKNALPFSQQLSAALLLTLSNLLFVPPVVVALHRAYHVEAAVYFFTMFFSTFYHACDQPGVTVMCIMDYDTLQFCDFLGSVVAVWVTIICMARLQEPVKYVFFMAGTLIIAMAMQLDRRGLWNLLGPVLVALVTMVTAWVYRAVKRHHCYPPTWRRWVFFLIPGVMSALIGVCVYTFAQTDANYYYTHSIWHAMVATSVVFLLPPREVHMPPWGWPAKLCGYRVCRSQKEELYTVT
uniref:EGF-like domain-containing protein n=1 Tax=Electrophorus electricus TaxID=8005 RepID=A0A4W4FME9_ELEEL